MNLLIRLLFILLGVSACSGSAQEVVLADAASSVYSIVVPAESTPLEARSAKVLQDYIKRISGRQLPIVKEGALTTANGIYLGHTAKEGVVVPGKLPAEAYRLKMVGKDLVICGGSGKGLIYGVYTLIEKYFGCRKLGDMPALLPEGKDVHVPANLNEDGRPLFQYREAYYPAFKDAEYLEWHKMQRFEDLWGLWGHSYNKLVPAAMWFKTHPEYYAQVKGVRQPSQLCLSNEAVLGIVTDELKKRMAANPDAMYWSVAPNDENGWCECDRCKAIDNAGGSPAASLITFVNKVAAAFPDKQITTLAYGYTHRAPKGIKPAKNVYVFLSNIDVYRQQEITKEPTAAPFRKDVQEWKALTGNLFLWDYLTQFTNYLAPFPNLLTLQPNMQYYKDNGIKGIFAQGCGDTYGEFAELRSHLMVKLLQDEKADVKKLAEKFLTDYYGPAAKFLLQYIGQLHSNQADAKTKLDIYGNPVNDWNSWLSPEKLDAYSKILDVAEGSVETKTVYRERVARVRLSLDYVVLQQARFFGIEKYGIFEQKGSKWELKPQIRQMVDRFVATCKKAGVTELSEGGLSPDAYKAEWDAIFAAGVTPTIATGATVKLQYPNVPDYPAKGPKTLVDGTSGYSDFSYNWLCFYATDMVATIDLGVAKNITGMKMHFLDDPRHWIFLPSSVVVEVSDDGVTFRPFASFAEPMTEEHYEVTVKPFAAEAKARARFVRVTAKNIPALPSWRQHDSKKPMLACDEIFVQ